MHITNFKKLAKNPLRKKALLIAEAGYEAIDITQSIKRKIKRERIKEGDFLTIFHQNPEENGAIKVDLNDYKRVIVFGIGKGSALASITLAKILGQKLTGGIALDVTLPKLKIKNFKLKIFKGTHPMPSKQNIKATKEIAKLAKSLNKDDLLINFICGGGSALACSGDWEMKDSVEVTKALTKAGANISELNAVRKHFSEIKGGGLAKMAYPATVISLIVSDVCGNDLSTVASGPTVFDKTTKKSAASILKKYGLKFPVSRLVETPKDKKYFKNVQNVLFVCNQDAILSMLEKSGKLGFDSRIYSLALEGEAKEIFTPLIKQIKRHESLLIAGETTITFNLTAQNEAPCKCDGKSEMVGGVGKGGRNQEVILGALERMSKGKLNAENVVFMSFASDAYDHTEAAGAIGDSLSAQKAKKAKLDVSDYLCTHSTFEFFQKTGDAVYAKKDCFNVSDLMLIIRD